jgi:teichuronic acid biosynthesis glycosyltransferase TuaG
MRGEATPPLLVSVVTPAHNAGTTIERTIRSVAAQTLPVLEHIIVDDGSTDDTADIVRSLQETFPGLRYTFQRRQGAAAARNLAIEQAAGRYIAFLDSDDCWLERKLEYQIGFMEETGALFTYGDYRIRDAATGRILRECRRPESLDHHDLLRACPIGCLTAAYNQERLGKRYMPMVRRGQDWGLWLALTRAGTPAYKYPGMAADYYTSPNSLSANKLLKSGDMYRIFRRQEGLGPLRAMWYLGCHAVSRL